jgi:hypothetical protein
MNQTSRELLILKVTPSFGFKEWSFIRIITVSKTWLIKIYSECLRHNVYYKLQVIPQ